MSETRVVNKYKESYDVYIGRGSKWGTLLHTYRIRKLKLNLLLIQENRLLRANIVTGL